MAKNDWKRIINEKDQIMFKKSDDEKIIITDESREKRKKWIVGTVYKTGKSDWHFKTKFEALKYAKAYMKLH